MLFRSLCPVCGFAGGFDEHSFVTGADGLDHGVIGTGICPCCLFEPGFDDDPMASGTPYATLGEVIATYRASWRTDGCPWRGNVEARPAQWESAAQLKTALALIATKLL